MDRAIQMTTSKKKTRADKILCEKGNSRFAKDQNQQRVTSLCQRKDFVVVAKASERKCRSRCRNRLCGRQLASNDAITFERKVSLSPATKIAGVSTCGMKPDYYPDRRMKVISEVSFGTECLSRKYLRALQYRDRISKKMQKRRDNKRSSTPEVILEICDFTSVSRNYRIL